MDSKFQTVSVAMAAYNGARFIGQQLDSVLGQSLKPQEIIVVDDGSTDETLNILESYRQKHPQLKVIRNKRNLGVTKTFERAISECHSELIALSDQDDIWLPEKLEVLAEEIGDYDAVYSDSMLVDEEGKPLNKLFSSMMNLQTFRNGVPFLLSNTIAGHTMMIKRKFAAAIVPFPAELYFDLWIAYNAAGGNGIRFVDKVLVYYRQHDLNVVGTRMSTNKKAKLSATQEFERKRHEISILASAPVADTYTKNTSRELLELFHRGPSFRRSMFFFRHFSNILAAKRKRRYRKVLYCLKMFFKPNY